MKTFLVGLLFCSQALGQLVLRPSTKYAADNVLEQTNAAPILANLSAPRYVSTFADLATCGTNGPSVVETLGYAAAGDGGGGKFVRVAASTYTTNIGTVINGVGCQFASKDWLEKGQATIRQFGAKGDGVTDDAPAVKAALAASTNVVFPPGNYSVDVLTTKNSGSVILAAALAPRSGSVITFDNANLSIPGSSWVSVNLTNLTLGASWTLTDDDLSKAGAGTDTVTLVKTGGQNYLHYYVDFTVSGTVGSGVTISDSNGGSSSVTTTGRKHYFAATANNSNFTLTITPAADFTGTLEDVRIMTVNHYVMWSIESGVSNVVFRGTGTMTGLRFELDTDPVLAHLFYSHLNSRGVKISGLTLKSANCLVGLKGYDHAIDNLWLEGGDNCAVALTDNSGFVMENCTVYNNFPSPWNEASPSGVDMEPNSASTMMDDVVIRGCRFIDNWTGLILQQGAWSGIPDNIRVKDNTFIRCLGWGLRSTTTRGIDVSGNTFEDCGSSQTYPSPNTTALANNSSMWLSAVVGATVSGNQFYTRSATLQEVLLTSSITNCNVANNQFYKLGGTLGSSSAVVSWSAYSSRFSGNVLKDGSYTGLLLIGGKQSIVSENMFTNFTRSAVISSGTTTGHTLRGNAVYDCPLTNNTTGGFDFASGAGGLLITGNKFSRVNATAMNFCIRMASGVTAPVSVDGNDFSGGYSVYPVVDQNTVPVSIWAGTSPLNPNVASRNMASGSRVYYGSQWWMKTADAAETWVAMPIFLGVTTTTPTNFASGNWWVSNYVTYIGSGSGWLIGPTLTP